ncbi:hypothetical protein [Actinocatenispora rupis]|uniref:Uncharacterized protein n=1 Tax=Actinocatenispora rupis TaxID=519421 RepID=A0A8J3J6U4_9ACTN|nr:hypothetical protein [Actinocatenispora rupis]GID13052.1 hypothetical protein Aru02nite_39410 [Actinocatenispora rupis]
MGRTGDVLDSLDAIGRSRARYHYLLAADRRRELDDLRALIVRQAQRLIDACTAAHLAADPSPPVPEPEPAAGP